MSGGANIWVYLKTLPVLPLVSPSCQHKPELSVYFWQLISCWAFNLSHDHSSEPVPIVQQSYNVKHTLEKRIRCLRGANRICAFWTLRWMLHCLNSASFCISASIALCWSAKHAGCVCAGVSFYFLEHAPPVSKLCNCTPMCCLCECLHVSPTCTVEEL